MSIEHISLDTDGSGTRDYVNPAEGIGGIDGGSSAGGNDGTLRDNGGNEFDPRIHASPDSRNINGTFRRKRGRRAGSGQNKAKVHSNLKDSAEMLSRSLMIFHTTIAAITRTPELVLDNDEAVGLSEASLKLMAVYDIEPNPKVEATIFFAGQVGLVYGSRIFAIKARKANEAKEKARKGHATVQNADGTNAGTTTFTAATEWPIGEENAGNIGSIN